MSPLNVTPPPLKGGHPYDGISLTPRGGNRRSILARTRPPWGSTAVPSLPLPSPRVARLRARRLVVFGGLMEKECSRPALLDKLNRSLNRDQNRAVFGFLSQSPAGADRALPAASVSLKSLSKEIVGRGISRSKWLLLESTIRYAFTW